MAPVPTENSPNPHRLNSDSRATSGHKQDTSGAQQQTIPDEKVDQLLIKAREPMVERTARDMAEVLEKMLDPRYPITLRARRRCFRGLVKLCGEYGILPSSCLVPESKIQKQGNEPVTSGGFSDVWRGKYENKRTVAIKVIRYHALEGVKSIQKDFCREVITLKRMSHPNILELVGVTMNDQEWAMISPWMANGDIMFHLKEHHETNPLKLLKDATCGIQYLHNLDLAHGDLRGANILVSETFRACLADVGLTRVASELSTSAGSTGVSTNDDGYSTRWSSPERLDPQRFGSKKPGPTKPSDIYSMGMTIYEVLTDKMPFCEYAGLTVMSLIGQGARPGKPIFMITRGYTKELWELTESCWNQDPARRPTVERVLEVLNVAAERWEPKTGGFSTLSEDNRNNGPPSDMRKTILDEKMDQLLAKAKEPMGERGARETAEVLEKMLDPRYQLGSQARRRCTRGLVELCREYGVLPDSYIIPESKIAKMGDSPFSTNHSSEIWAGEYEGDRFVAIKSMRYCGSDGVQETEKDFYREAVAWKRISHPNILEFIGAVVDGRGFAVVTPWMENIMHYLEVNADANPLKLLEGAARGLQYLHNLDFIHGDLRAENILVSEEGHACLAEVGFNTATEDVTSDTTELQRSDVYSMGMTTHEVLMGNSPVYAEVALTVFLFFGRGIQPRKPLFAFTRGYTGEIWELVTLCCREDPAERPSVDRILEVLNVAAERWEPNREDTSALTLQDDWSYDLCLRTDSGVIPEKKVDQLLIRACKTIEERDTGEITDSFKAREQTRGHDVREMAGVLGRMLDLRFPITSGTRLLCSRKLVELCEKYSVLPDSCIVPESRLGRLGDGPISVDSFTEVWRGLYEGRKPATIKSIRHSESDRAQEIKKVSRFCPHDAVQPDRLQVFCRGIVTWRGLSHPNVLSLIGVTMNDTEWTVISPRMENGDVMGYLRKFPRTNPLKLLEDAGLGLQYLHSLKLVHGNVTTANVLVSEEGHARLADVGLARVMAGLRSRANNTQMSVHERFVPTEGLDIYLMGTVIYEVLTDNVSFSEHEGLAAMSLVGRGVRPQKPDLAKTRGYTEDLWGLTSSFWNEKSDERPSIDHVLEILRVAAERWKPKDDAPHVLSQDVKSPAPCVQPDSSTPSEPEDQSGGSHQSPMKETITEPPIVNSNETKKNPSTSLTFGPVLGTPGGRTQPLLGGKLDSPVPTGLDNRCTATDACPPPNPPPLPIASPVPSSPMITSRTLPRIGSIHDAFEKETVTLDPTRPQGEESKTASDVSSKDDMDPEFSEGKRGKITSHSKESVGPAPGSSNKKEVKSTRGISEAETRQPFVSSSTRLKASPSTERIRGSGDTKPVQSTPDTPDVGKVDLRGNVSSCESVLHSPLVEDDHDYTGTKEQRSF